MKFVDLATSPYFKDISDANHGGSRSGQTYRDAGVTMFIIDEDSLGKGETIEWEGQKVTSFYRSDEGFNIVLASGDGRHFNIDEDVPLQVVRRTVEAMVSL